MDDLSFKIEKLLGQVSKPARYINSEINAIHKDWDTAWLKTVLIYPDIYDVGLPNLGLQILYGIINSREGWVAERAYLPWLDMIELMRAGDVPLFSLESQRPLMDFDVIGITLQHELTYSNIVHILSLAGIPRFSVDRDSSHPLIIGGGPAAFNPEPVADFFDAFIIGEAEDAIIEFLSVCEASAGSRQQLLEDLVKIPGVYIPSFYQPVYKDGRFAGIKKVNDQAPDRVTKRVIDDLDRIDIPTRPIIPYIDVVHDRSSVEVMRGCTRGCRFCQAGMIYRPLRERSPAKVKDAVESIIETGGYDEISLSSLSSADYSPIEALLEELSPLMVKDHVTISLPSLRVDSFSIELAARLSQVRKSGLTLAPEAGTQRLRDIINKGVTDDDIEAAATKIFTQGWQKLKLYFMIGLPGETQEDIIGIANIARKIRHLAFDILPKKQHSRIAIIVSVSNFAPKPNTPFQWFGCNSMDELLSKQDLLKDELRLSHVKFKWHDAEQSMFEAALARGDRRLGLVIADCADNGQILDAWSDYFSYQRWGEAFARAGYDIEQLATAGLADDDALPWAHIDCGVSVDWLLEEKSRAMTGEATPDCREECSGCGLCPDLGLKNMVGECR